MTNYVARAESALQRFNDPTTAIAHALLAINETLWQGSSVEAYRELLNRNDELQTNLTDLNHRITEALALAADWQEMGDEADNQRAQELRHILR